MSPPQMLGSAWTSSNPRFGAWLVPGDRSMRALEASATCPRRAGSRPSLVMRLCDTVAGVSVVFVKMSDGGLFYGAECQ